MVIAMAQEKESSQRRVYVLPQELVDRIVAFQRDRGFASEVEAVRKLLDEALLQRDNADLIIQRMEERVRTLRIPSEAAKDVLVGHPLITEIGFEPESVSFTVRGEGKFLIDSKADVYEWDSRAKIWQQKLPF